MLCFTQPHTPQITKVTGLRVFHVTWMQRKQDVRDRAHSRSGDRVQDTLGLFQLMITSLRDFPFCGFLVPKLA